jgi:hypothetical protein
MQTNNDMVIDDHPVSVYPCQTNDMDIEEEECNLDQGFCYEDLDEDAMDEPIDQNWDQGFAYEAIDPDGFDYNQDGFAYEPMDQAFAYEPMDQAFAQSEIHIEFPEGACIGFTIANGVRYLVLTNM